MKYFLKANKIFKNKNYTNKRIMPKPVIIQH